VRIPTALVSTHRLAAAEPRTVSLSKSLLCVADAAAAAAVYNRTSANQKGDASELLLPPPPLLRQHNSSTHKAQHNATRSQTSLAVVSG